MRILVVGGGGREHALCWKLQQSGSGHELYCAPGNPGIAAIADLVPVEPDEVHKLADFAAELAIELTVVGPELPLALGIVDEFQARGLPIFGPTQDAAQLESSKVFAKEFMRRHDIPTADFEVVHDSAQGREAAGRIGLPLVLKADGLAAGKGVLIVKDEKDLEEGLDLLFEQRRFGTSADRVVVEPFLEGEEISFMGLCDGRHVLPLATSKDYKRIGDGDSGPNTGGMGAHSPSGVLSAGEAAAALERVMMPVVSGMAEEDYPFVGVLYAGLMMTADGMQVLEFNVRFGDPEAQAILLRLEEDLAGLLAAGADGDFGAQRVHFKKGAAACIVLASEGYPGKPVVDEVIEGLDEAAQMQDVQVFHAGTALRDGQVVSRGGRVLNVCAAGSDLREALKHAYAAAALVEWPSKVLRSDIGRRVLEHRESR